MVTFLDGPAAGETLQLRRVPTLLRVVQDRRGEWDALDQLTDTPKATETIYVYRRRDDLEISQYHLLTGRPRRAGSGFFWRASYSVLPEQPSDDQVRETAAWRAWVTSFLEREAGPPTLLNFQAAQRKDAPCPPNPPSHSRPRDR